MKIKILGIDPALQNTGLSIGEYCLDTGDLQVTHLEIAQTRPGKEGKQVRKSSDDLTRARVIVAEIKRVISIHKPHFAAAEVPGGCQNARGAFSNGICCGILASIVLPIIEVSPLEVKLASAGDKNASKAQMIQWAVGRWPNAGWMTRKVKGEVKLLNDNEHMADACAAISAGILTPQFAQATAMLSAMKAAA